jgi:hypothetical protein
MSNARMSFTTPMEKTKEHISEAQHNIKIVMSEVLRNAPFEAQRNKSEVVVKLRKALTLLGDTYTLLTSIHIAESDILDKEE